MKLFRAMRVLGEFPAVGATARTLGIRPGIDVDATEQSETVQPRCFQGMSVAPGDLMHLPEHRRPEHFGGTGKDPVWSIDEHDLGTDLQFWQDRPDHGMIGPAATMTLGEFTNALERTREKWRRVDD